MRYAVHVTYRTNSGLGATTVNVVAPDMLTALALARDIVAKRRGVVRVDTCDTKMAAGA